MSGGDTKQSRLESTTEITQNKHVKVLHICIIYGIIRLNCVIVLRRLCISRVISCQSMFCGDSENKVMQYFYMFILRYFSSRL
jgi:hypothetical protein